MHARASALAMDDFAPRVPGRSAGLPNKDPDLQPLILENLTNQILEGNQSIVGAMIESNIGHGNQSIPANLDDLQYGVSVTDACIDWDTTEKSILAMRDKLKDVLPSRGA